MHPWLLVAAERAREAGMAVLTLEVVEGGAGAVGGEDGVWRTAVGGGAEEEVFEEEGVEGEVMKLLLTSL